MPRPLGADPARPYPLPSPAPITVQASIRDGGTPIAAIAAGTPATAMPAVQHPRPADRLGFASATCIMAPPPLIDMLWHLLARLRRMGWKKMMLDTAWEANCSR